MQPDAGPTFAFTMSPAAEGGDEISLDRADNGNWTSNEAGTGRLIGSKWGVSATDLIGYLIATTRCTAASVTAASMAALTETQALAIWSPGYWQAMRCADLPVGVDLQTADHGYNRGIHAGGVVLQRTAGITGADVDGWIGDQTIAAVALAIGRAGLPALSDSAARCLQRRLGVGVDGNAGPITRAALAALPPATGSLLSFIARLADAQAADYATLAQFAMFGADWTTRTYARCDAALALTVIGASA